jgi:hypothetical protein
MKKFLLLPLVLVCAAPYVPAQIEIKIQDPSRANSGDIAVPESGVVRAIECMKNSVFIRGNKNTITVTGLCASVHVLGNENTVTVDRADRLVAEGDRNIINYRYPNMAVMTPGIDNKVHVVK